MNLTYRNASGLLIVLLVSSLAKASDWTQFRGADGRSVVLDAEAPTEWGPEKNLAWKVEMPGRAVNGVIVVQGNVIATSSSGPKQDRLHVWCLDEASGKVKWKRNFFASGRSICHPLSAMAAPTPASDGQRIFALFATNDLICLDLEGNIQWIRALQLDYPSAFDDRGLASSPLVVGGTVIVQIACQGDSIALGLDATNGADRWKKELAQATSWATPAPIQIDGQSYAVVQSADQVEIVEPVSGESVWSYAAPGNLIPSPTVEQDTIYLPSSGLTTLRFERGQKEPTILWKEAQLGPGSGSAVIADNRVYVIRGSNVLTCGDATTGEKIWQKRLKGSRMWATPVLLGKHLYVVNVEGLVQVIDVSGEEGKLVAENDLGEEILGSPAYANGAIYWRGVNHIFKVAGT